jgi:glutamate transport system permease protein
MTVLFDNIGTILNGFVMTLRLLAVSAIVATVLGLALCVMRIAAAPTPRRIATTYVTLVRNTPPLLVFVAVCYGLPQLGLSMSFFTRAVTALSLYTAAFVCEVLRSGVQAVPSGQAEAARAIGMTSVQTLRIVILRCAIRNVVGPLASVYIALLKNTALAEVFGVAEATFQLDSLIRDHPHALYPVFIGIAAGYVLIAYSISATARAVERQLSTAR